MERGKGGGVGVKGAVGGGWGGWRDGEGGRGRRGEGAGVRLSGYELPSLLSRQPVWPSGKALCW